MKVAVIGLGRWGPNLAKCFHQLESLAEICDLTEFRASQFQASILMDYKKVESDAVAIATPYQTHYEIAKFFLESGRHVLIEKPMCETSDQCRELIELAEKKKKMLMVGHTYMYNQAIRDMMKLFPNPKQIKNISCQWQNLDPPGRSLKDTVWNVAPHAISIILKAMGYKKPEAQVLAVKPGAIQIDLCGNQIELDWIHKPKWRQVIIEGKKQIGVFEEAQYRTLAIYKGNEGKRIPYNDNPLLNECQHFIACCESINMPLCNETFNIPQTPGEEGLEVVNVLESLNL